MTRNKSIVIKSQFNINGSRGKDVGYFIRDYVARSDGTDSCSSYVGVQRGDGVAFSFDNGLLSQDEVLAIADEVQRLHDEGDRAIQQMVISFDPMYLERQGVVKEGTRILLRGDYEGEYDDVRLKYAIRSGVKAMMDQEGYRDGRMIGTIQHDTQHLHAHVVCYEKHPKLARLYGKEERGVVKGKSFEKLANELTRYLDLTYQEDLVLGKKVVQRKQKEDIKEEKVGIKVAEIPLDIQFFMHYINEQMNEGAIEETLGEQEGQEVDLSW